MSFAYDVKAELCKVPIEPELLRRGRGLRRAAVRQRIHRKRGAHHHGK